MTYQPPGRCFTRKKVLVPGKLLPQRIGQRVRFSDRKPGPTLKLSRAAVVDISKREMLAREYAALYGVSLTAIYDVWRLVKKPDVGRSS